MYIYNMLNYIDHNGQIRRDPLQSPYELGYADSASGPAAVRPKFDPSDEREEPGQDTVFYQVLKKKNQSQKKSENSAALPAESIMTRDVITLLSGTTLKNAFAVFSKNSFRHVPVVGGENKILGIVSYHSLYKTLSDSHEDPALLEKTVGELMVKNVLVATPKTRIDSLALNLVNKKVGAIPIADEHGQLIGIVTRSDVLRAAYLSTSAIDVRG